MGRPVELIGGRFAGGGGMGRPVELIGGRGGPLRVSPASPPGAVLRCVGRMVCGPSGDAVRTGAAGFGAAVRVRTTRGASAAGASLIVSGVTVSVARDSSTTGVAAGTSAVVLAAFLAVVFFFCGSSGWTARTRPSALALLRARVAWASSIEDETPLWPILSESNTPIISGVVRPNSLAKADTRIFFGGKTFLLVCYGQPARNAQFLFSHTLCQNFILSNATTPARSQHLQSLLPFAAPWRSDGR